MSINTSHDPKTDHRSLVILVGLAALSFVSILGAFGVFSDESVKTADEVAARYNPHMEFEYDGCTVYSFIAEEKFLVHKIGYFARCNNGKAATTLPDGTTILTEPVK